MYGGCRGWVLGGLRAGRSLGPDGAVVCAPGGVVCALGGVVCAPGGVDCAPGGVVSVLGGALLWVPGGAVL